MSSASSLCPICSRTSQHFETIEVCESCHRNVQVATTASVTSTGEFSVSELMNLAEATRAQPVKPPVTTASCSWCGRGQSEVRKLLSQGELHICNACVGFCADIMQAELGDDWAG